MYPPQIAQNVEMQRRRLDRFRAALAQPVEVPLGCREFEVAQGDFLREKLPGLADIPGHEDAEGDTK